MADNVAISAGTGTTIATDDLTDAGGAHVQFVKLMDGTANSSVKIAGEPFGALQVNTGFSTLFYDAWSSALDTTDKWTVTGTTPTIANGNMTMSAVLSTYHAIRSKDVIRSNAGFTLVRNGISLETTAATGAGRFWGLGTTATTPAAAVLAQDGVGFEIDQAAGTLLAVTYAAGVRTTVATLTRPADGATHAYGVYFRVTQAYWFLDGVQVAAQSFPNVQVAELPALIVRQNAASFTGTPAFVNIAHLTADTSRQGQVIADPIIGTRMARVGPEGTLKVSAPRPKRTSVTSSGLTIATTAYVAGDQVGARFDFAAQAAATAGGGYLESIQLHDEAGIVGTYTVWLFRDTVTAAADNAAFTLSDADAQKLIGDPITLGPVRGTASTYYTTGWNGSVPYDCVGTTLYALLQTNAGHTFFGAATNLKLVLTTAVLG